MMMPEVSLWFGLFVMAGAAIFVSYRYGKSHRREIAIIQDSIAVIRDSRIALEGGKFRVRQQSIFESKCGIAGQILFERFGVQAAHLTVPPGSRFPTHIHENTGEIYVITAGECNVLVYSDEKRTFSLLNRNLSSVSPLIRGRVAYIDPGSWHEILAGPEGCELLNFSVPPQVFELEKGL